jgi:phospholipid/cholesterol/gamma-HCH transport system substrate-binding protein
VSAPKKRTELLVGVFIFIGLAILGGLILQFGRFQRLRADTYPLTVLFEDASGIIRGSEVRMGGARIGRVSEQPELTEDLRVRVELEVNERIGIPEGSRFQIASATLLGDKLVIITPPPVEQRTSMNIPPGSVVIGGGVTGLDAIQHNAEALIEEVIRILANTEGTLIKVDDALSDIRVASTELGLAMSKVNQSILADDNLAHIDTTLANIASASERWKDVSEDLQPTLAEARSAIRAIESAAAGADATMAELQPAIERVPAAVDSISAVADKAGSAIDRLQDGEGLLGLLEDDETAGDARDFIRNLRQHGILRYRDTEPLPEDDPRTRFRGRRR